MQVFAVLGSVQSFPNPAEEGPDDAYASPDPCRCWGKSLTETGRNSVCSLDCGTFNETTPEKSTELLITGKIPSRV